MQNYNTQEQRITQVESELMAKHKDWSQSKANYFAKKLLCIIY